MKNRLVGHAVFATLDLRAGETVDLPLPETVEAALDFGAEALHHRNRLRVTCWQWRNDDWHRLKMPYPSERQDGRFHLSPLPPGRYRATWKWTESGNPGAITLAGELEFTLPGDPVQQDEDGHRFLVLDLSPLVQKRFRMLPLRDEH